MLQSDESAYAREKNEGRIEIPSQFRLAARPFFSFRNSKYEFFDAVRPEQRIVLRAEKIAEMGELLQFRVDAVVNGKCVSEGELVLTKTPVQRDASSR